MAMGTGDATAVEKKLDMSLDDIVQESNQQSPAVSGKSRSTKRSDRIASAGPYPQRAARIDETDGTPTMHRRVYVGNLSFSVKWQDLKDHMAAAGTVVHARILQSNGRSKGCGLVEYATVEEAQNAFKTLNDSTLHGRLIFVREDREPDAHGAPATQSHGDENMAPVTNTIPVGTRVYVGNLSWNVKWQDLKDHMKAAGTVKHADVLTEPSGRSKGCGLVEYETAEEATRAIEILNDTEIDGRKIFVREDREPEGGSIASIARRMDALKGPSKSQEERRKSGFKPRSGPRGQSFPPDDFNGSWVEVSNLNFEVDEELLQMRFHGVGEVDRAEIMYREDGRSRGFGYVHYVRKEDAARAVELLNDVSFRGRKMTVRHQQRRQDF